MTKGQPTKNCYSNRWGWKKLLFQLAGFLIYTILYNFRPTIIYSIHARAKWRSESADRKAKNQSNAERTKNRKRFYEYAVGAHPWMVVLAWHTGHTTNFIVFDSSHCRSGWSGPVLNGIPVLEWVYLCYLSSAWYSRACLFACINFQSRGLKRSLKYGVCVIHSFSLLLYITIIMSCLTNYPPITLIVTFVIIH